jgi:hypothetical protein
MGWAKAGACRAGVAAREGLGRAQQADRGLRGAGGDAAGEKPVLAQGDGTAAREVGQAVAQDEPVRHAGAGVGADGEHGIRRAGADMQGERLLLRPGPPEVEGFRRALGEQLLGREGAGGAAGLAAGAADRDMGGGDVLLGQRIHRGGQAQAGQPGLGPRAQDDGETQHGIRGGGAVLVADGAGEEAEAGHGIQVERALVPHQHARALGLDALGGDGVLHVQRAGAEREAAEQARHAALQAQADHVAAVKHVGPRRAGAGAARHGRGPRRIHARG